MKIKVTSCELKVDKGSFKVYQVTTEDLQTLDAFEELTPGQEYEGEIKENANPEYNSQFRVKKERKFGSGKDWTFEKRRVALENTCLLIAHGKVPMDNLIECRNKFFEYLNAN